MIETEVAVIGTGFAGLGMAIKLKAAGIPFVVLEAAHDVGGTWRDNTYPGCACDIPSELYSFSFEPSTEWSRDYPAQPEILAYLRRCVVKYGLRPHVRLGAEVAEVRWDDSSHTWTLSLRSGDSVRARAVVSAMGGLSRPHVPDVPGLASFAGDTFHSQQWNHEVDLTGKRVAVIGTGASAIQFVPKIAPAVAHLTLFQRSAPWILPKRDRPVTAGRRAVRRWVPFAAALRRKLIYWMLEIRVLGFTSFPQLNRKVEALALAFMERQIKDPVLRAKLTPDYRMGCKRILLASDYFPALARDNVDLITGGVREVRPHGVVDTRGVEHPADVLILATGFRATDAVSPVTITGRQGHTIAQAWRDGMEAFLGITVSGFPNFFLLVGPNTGLGHNSMVFMIEAQIAYVMQALQHARGGNVLDVLPQAQQRFNRALQKRMAKTVWTSGCRSWYLDANGKNTTLWPGFSFVYRLRTRRFDPAAYAEASAPST
jgi:cation diffusion facilitator CzcD-associated flavoprotein CzcO